MLLLLMLVSSNVSAKNLWFLYVTICSLCVHKVLDGSESQYSGMQIGTLQDEEDEAAAPTSQEEPSEPFLQSALGVFQGVNTGTIFCVEKQMCFNKVLCFHVQL